MVKLLWKNQVQIWLVETLNFYWLLLLTNHFIMLNKFDENEHTEPGTHHITAQMSFYFD